MKSDIFFPKKEDIQFFRDNGYWISPKLFDDQTLENAISRMDALYREEYETGMPPKGVHWKYGDDPLKLRKSSNAHYSDKALYNLVPPRLSGLLPHPSSTLTVSGCSIHNCCINREKARRQTRLMWDGIRICNIGSFWSIRLC